MLTSFHQILPATCVYVRQRCSAVHPYTDLFVADIPHCGRVDRESRRASDLASHDRSGVWSPGDQ